MKAYRAADLEAADTLELLKDWAGEGWITPEQRTRMERETVCGLRRTHLFLRLVLFFFTKIIVSAAVGLTYILFFPHTSAVATGLFLLVMAAALYWAAEQAVAEKAFYRYGIEEALACGAVLFLVVGLAAMAPREADVAIPAAGAAAAWWLWYRFGFFYAVPAAMAFAAWLPGNWTRSSWIQHLAVAAIYAAGLAAVARARGRHRLTHRDGPYALAEAFLWLGIYGALNLPLSSLDLARVWIGATPAASAPAIPKALYWLTWVATWALPPVILLRGARGKDRAVIAVGLLTAVLTLATNKAYLGWARHPWDPMLLGLLLAGAALTLRRWLEAGPKGVRAGFTARRLSGKDQALLEVSGSALGVAAPGITTAPASAAPAPDTPQFGGGQSGGGGASSDF